MMYLHLAWRNLMRNKRRTILTVGTIALALVLVIVINAMQTGNVDEVTTFTARQFQGDLQITHADYQDDPVLTNSFASGAVDWDALGIANLDASAPRVSSFGLVSSDEGSAGAMVIGVDPEREADVTTFLRTVREGEGLTATDHNEVLLGHLLARTLEVNVGDTIAILSQGMRGEMAAELFHVKGLLRTNQVEVDRRMVIMPLVAAQEFFFMPGRVTHLVYRTHDLRAAEATVAELTGALPADAAMEARAWPELIPELVQLVDLAQVRNWIFMAFLLILVSFEIFNTTMMSVLERGREFGLMQSIGMRPLSVGVVVFLEWLMKLVLAAAVGLGLAYGVILYLWHNPIPVGELGDIFEAFGIQIEYLMVATRLEVFLMPLAVLLVIAIPAIIYPFVRTVRQQPLDALRTT